MSQVCEISQEDDDNNFNLIPEDINESEEQQKILRNLIEEFKKNKGNKNQKKLYNSSTIKKPIYYHPNNNRNQMPSNINGQRNEEGTFSEIKVEKMPDGKEKITQTRYDKNHKVISSKIYYKNNNINNLNYNNVNNQQQNNLNQRHIFRAADGFTIETYVYTRSNGKKYETKLIKDPNNIIVDIQEDEIIENRNNIHHNNHNNINNQAPIYSMPPPLMHNNNINHPFIPNNNMNNMGLNPNFNNFRNNNQINQINPMYPMNQMYNPMNQINPMNNMNGMQMQMPMMNNFGYPFMMMPMGFPNINFNRVDPRILNSLPESEVADASKLDPDNRNCVICLEDFKDKDHITSLPCIHVFHSECIKSWLNSNKCCPTCKFELTFENLNAHS